jgi:uncharacterized phage infection (PIP) family protein YhgE
VSKINLHFHAGGTYEIAPISIRLENPSVAGRLDAIDAKLNQLTSGQQAMAATAQDVLDKVAALKDRADAENALLDEVHQMLLDAQAAAPTAQLQQAIDQLDAIRQGAVDAITRNTPDAPAATV